MIRDLGSLPSGKTGMPPFCFYPTPQGMVSPMELWYSVSMSDLDLLGGLPSTGPDYSRERKGYAPFGGFRFAVTAGCA